MWVVREAFAVFIYEKGIFRHFVNDYIVGLIFLQGHVLYFDGVFAIGYV